MDKPAPFLSLGVFLFVGGLAVLLAGPPLMKTSEDLHLLLIVGGLALVAAAAILALGTYMFAQDHTNEDDID